MVTGFDPVKPNPSLSTEFLQTLWKSTLLASSPVWAVMVPIDLLATLANVTNLGDLAFVLRPIIFSGYAIFVAFVAVLVGLLCIGLPVTWLFNRLNIWKKSAYQLSGAIGGAALMLICFIAAFGETWPGSIVICLVMVAHGGFMGAISAGFWWRSLIMPTLNIQGYSG